MVRIQANTFVCAKSYIKKVLATREKFIPMGKFVNQCKIML